MGWLVLLLMIYCTACLLIIQQHSRVFPAAAQCEHYHSHKPSAAPTVETWDPWQRMWKCHATRFLILLLHHNVTSTLPLWSASLSSMTNMKDSAILGERRWTRIERTTGDITASVDICSAVKMYLPPPNISYFCIFISLKGLRSSLSTHSCKGNSHTQQKQHATCEDVPVRPVI